MAACDASELWTELANSAGRGARSSFKIRFSTNAAVSASEPRPVPRATQILSGLTSAESSGASACRAATRAICCRRLNLRRRAGSNHRSAPNSPQASTLARAVPDSAGTRNQEVGAPPPRSVAAISASEWPAGLTTPKPTMANPFAGADVRKL